MEIKFKDVKIGQYFRVVGEIMANTGQESILISDKRPVLIKIPFMENFYQTTGNKRNTKMVRSTSRMNNKYFYIDDEQPVELV